MSDKQFKNFFFFESEEFLMPCKVLIRKYGIAVLDLVPGWLVSRKTGRIIMRVYEISTMHYFSNEPRNILELGKFIKNYIFLYSETHVLDRCRDWDCICGSGSSTIWTRRRR